MDVYYGIEVVSYFLCVYTIIVAYWVTSYLLTGMTISLQLDIAMLGHFVNDPTVMLANFIATPVELR